MGNLINTVIIDDTEAYIQTLSSSLKGYENINIVGTAIDGTTGEKIILKKQPELVFLDVEMPDINGIDLLRQIQEQITWQMQIIFYTAYDKYLLDALRESAFDYLLKPFEKQELDVVMQRYYSYIEKIQKIGSFGESLTKLLPGNTSFMVSTVNGLQILRIDQIGYFKYSNKRKYWEVVSTDLKELQLKRNTNAKDILNYSSSFVQVNRDHIINIDYLSMVRSKDCILMPPFNDVSDLTISSGFIKTLQDKFCQI
jgi:two-component system LytT family response regulator